MKRKCHSCGHIVATRFKDTTSASPYQLSNLPTNCDELRCTPCLQNMGPDKGMWHDLTSSRSQHFWKAGISARRSHGESIPSFSLAHDVPNFSLASVVLQTARQSI